MFSYPSILLSVSGGQDSMSILMLVLHLYKQQPTWVSKVGILHCQHGWTELDLQIATRLSSIADLLEIPVTLLSQGELPKIF